MTRFLVLEESEESLDDIQTYLSAGFDDICRRNHNSMKHVEKPWPPEHVLDTLCERSSGHFIYAATVLKFVGQKMTHPVTQLNIIIPACRTTSPFSDLDQLYLQVLATHPRPSELVDILGFFMVVDKPHPTLLDDLLDYQPGTVTMSLSGLQSLVKIPDIDCYYKLVPSRFLSRFSSRRQTFWKFLRRHEMVQLRGLQVLCEVDSPMPQ